MKHGLELSKVCFAVALAGIGVLSLVYGDFALQWQPVPKWVPWRESLAYASGALLIVGSVGLLLKRFSALSAFVLTVYILSWVLLLHAPRVVAAPGNVGEWLGLFENLARAAGGWIFFASAEIHGGGRSMEFAAGENGVRIATFLFAISLPVFGLAHLMYADFTATMVPAWLPQRVGLAYLTGAAHIAAGVGLLFGIMPRLAAILETIMMGSFVCLVHIPGVVADPTSRLQWTMLFVALALTAAAGAVASSLSGSLRRGRTLRLGGSANR